MNNDESKPKRKYTSRLGDMIWGSHPRQEGANLLDDLKAMFIPGSMVRHAFLARDFYGKKWYEPCRHSDPVEEQTFVRDIATGAGLELFKFSVYYMIAASIFMNC